MNFPEHKKFSKIPRLSRDIIITEKIDGSNGIIYISEDEEIYVGSRNVWLWGSIQDKICNDNYGFANWCKSNKEELMKLGEGYHYGEWWGSKIQRGYGMKEKRFSLFNVSRWNETTKPKCCSVVPILYEGDFDTNIIEKVLKDLEINGSYACPGYMNPEGIVIYHTQGNVLFKKTIKGDKKGKGVQNG
jgi:hypothetical protein